MSHLIILTSFLLAIIFLTALFRSESDTFADDDIVMPR
jgi:hypothetical protein